MQRIIITSKFSILFFYLNQFPLKSMKNLSFQRVYQYKLLKKKDYWPLEQ